MAASILRVFSNWSPSTSLLQPLRGPKLRHAALWNSQTHSIRRLCVRSLSVQDEGNAIESLAMDLALKAGTMIKDKSGLALQVDTKESRFDLVTEVDKACEDFLRTQVQEKFPNHFYLGEETFTDQEFERLRSGLKDSEWTWIVDPIDGTLNFVAGMPLSVVSIGVALGQNMEIGVVYNPFNNELFYARRGQGAYLNGMPIKVLPHDTELEDSTVSVGFPSKPEWRLRMLEDIGKVAPNARSVRALGTAPWDVAAARLIVEEAGGKVTDMNGNVLPLTAGSILASNGGILHDRIVQLVSD
ncbi:inositol monophosphatase 3 isoform X2 [Physcomitrium patens]|uniref:Inositol-1-monophosphatase n=1 Tax=Physcomitrium patens TaxID=3218 RepID=A0A7I4C762_PHYPA|nr:inositol monophosphatase 3-like isoform X2 [Physcomitrium patens]|eukprot:XP_024359739.1 inositol monophosphatase 3-like isoform X2 [Physcomitrella patens]